METRNNFLLNYLVKYYRLVEKMGHEQGVLDEMNSKPWRNVSAQDKKDQESKLQSLAEKKTTIQNILDQIFDIDSIEEDFEFGSLAFPRGVKQ